METLCSSSLADVGATVEDFIDALESSNLGEDVSRAVFEQLVAMDDFVTFKNLMVGAMYTTLAAQSNDPLNVIQYFVNEPTLCFGSMARLT